jgi:hypothetical protein
MKRSREASKSYKGDTGAWKNSFISSEMAGPMAMAK